MKKVLITGGTGFIGSHLVRANLAAGNRVRILALPDDPSAQIHRDLGCEIHSGDIRNFEDIERATSDIEIVFHLAAVVSDWAPRKLFHDVNITGMKNICRACLHNSTGRLIEVSTNDVFGLRENVIIDETFNFEYWGEPYADTKLEAARIVFEYSKMGLPISMVYPCWVYGPGDLTFVPLVADAIRKQDLIFWRKDVIIWPTYIDNVIDLLMVTAEHPAAVGEGFLVHDGVSDTFQHFSKKISESIGEQSPRLHIPYWSAYTAAWLMEFKGKMLNRHKRPLLTRYTVKNLGSRLQFSIQKAEKLLGWTPIIDYQTGFERTMSWLEQTNPDLWRQK
ncbi:hypothetical protein BVY01_00345 [bacterium I07]|nr:hypothetical protein BVY01_00345 [bacterium I07]